MATRKIAALALESLLLQFLDADGAQEMIAEIKKLIDAKAAPGDITSALADYAKTQDVNTLIEAAIAASEKKIFGEGVLDQAFDTIKEIGDYLKDHDDVATAIYAALEEKADQDDLDEVSGKVDTLESNMTTAQGDIAKLKSDKLDAATYNSEKAKFLTEENLEGYVTESDLEEMIQPIPTDTIKGWFASL